MYFYFYYYVLCIIIKAHFLSHDGYLGALGALIEGAHKKERGGTVGTL